VKFADYLQTHKRWIEETLERLLPAPEGPARSVCEAMRYAVLGGGKRLRPILALAACEACAGDVRETLEPAAALELIHTYSLIHDDLPSMDDDDLRRGRPTVHRAFGEAQAILAGDALLTLGFEILAAFPCGEANHPRRTDATRTVARCAGIHGMVGGQTADLEAERHDVNASVLGWIHRHKTGALFSASAELGGIHAGASPDQREALKGYGEAVGLAFQITDDVLDRTSTAETLGKTPGKDQRSGKVTFPTLFGLERSRREADELVARAMARLEPLQLLSDPLRKLAELAVTRVC
jgi:geranylgeranyl diphosphate synthase type II